MGCVSCEGCSFCCCTTISMLRTDPYEEMSVDFDSIVVMAAFLTSSF